MPKNRVEQLLCFVQLVLVVVCLAFSGAANAADKSFVGGISRLDVFPERFELKGPRASTQLVVTGHLNNGEILDASSTVSFVVANPEVLSVSASGRVTPKQDGETQIRISLGGSSKTVTARVSDQQTAAPVSFEHETLPALAKAGCSGGACHGSPHGKGEFRLSLFEDEQIMDYTLGLAQEEIL